MKKTISILLVLCIVFTGVMPHTVYANDGDEEPPFIQIYPESDTTWYTQDVTVTITGNNVEYKSKNLEDQNEPEWQNYTGVPLQYTQEGSFVLDAKSDDEPVTTTSINIDKTNPTLTVHVVNVWRNDYATIEFEATDPIGTSDLISGFDKIVLKNGESETEVELDYDESDGIYTASYKVYANGDYTYYALDKAGNKSTNLLVSVTKIDKNSPTESPYIDYVDSQSPSVNGWFTGTVGVELDYSRIETQPNGESTQRPQYSFDNNTWVDYSEVENDNPPIEISNEGESNVYAITRDLAENKSEPEILTVKIDNTDPTLEVTGNDDLWSNKNITLTLNAYDEHSGVAGIYKKGEQDPLTTSTYTFSENIDSEVRFYAVDNSGKESDDCVVNIKIDKTKPNAPAISANYSGWTHDNVAITLETVDPTDNLSNEQRQYKIGDGKWKDYSVPFEVTVEGEYDVLARTIDAAGNISDDTNSVTVKIDKIHPDITDVHYEANEAKPGKGTVKANISDARSGILEKRFDSGQPDEQHFEEGGGTLFNGSSFEIDGYANAQYTIFAKDKAGNVTLVRVHDIVEEMNTHPSMDDIAPQESNEDTQHTVTITGISDNETTYDELTLSYEYSGSLLQTPISLMKNTDNTATLTYTPKENVSGEDSIIIKVTDKSSLEDSDGLITSKTIAITIKPVNDAPAAVNDVKNLIEDDDNKDINIVVLENDSDIDLDNIFINSYSPETEKGGTIEINSERNGFIYNPKDTNFAGTDTFTYTIRDFENPETGTGLESNEATVTINIANVNDKPIANDDNYSINEDEENVYFNVLENDDDYDLGLGYGEALTISIVDSEGNELVKFDGNDPDVYVIEAGEITYDSGRKELHFEPSQDYNGSFSFNYILTDTQNEESEQATVDVTVISVNDEPEFSGLQESYTFPEDTVLYDAIVFSISDVEVANASALTLRAISQSQSILSNSQIEIVDIDDDDDDTTLDLKLVLTPSENVNGEVVIKLDLSDGNIVTTESITIDIESINDAPTVQQNLKVYYTEEESVTFDLDHNDYQKYFSDIDIPKDVLVATIDSSSIEGLNKTTQGELVVDQEDVNKNKYTFNPADDCDENIELNFTLSDGAGGSCAAKITLIAKPINDGPWIEEPSPLTNEYETDEDIPKGILPADAAAAESAEVGDLLMFTIGDVDNDLDDLKISFKSLNDELIVSENIEYKIIGNTVYAKITPNSHEPDDLLSDISEITVTVSDGQVQDSVTFNFTVHAVQNAPVAVDDTFNVAYNGFANIYPLENDYDFDANDVIKIQSITGSNGQVAISDDKTSLVYTAKANFVGEDVLTYTIYDDDGDDENDEDGNTCTGQITVTVGLDNVAPEIDHILDTWSYEDTSPQPAVSFNIIDPDTDDFSKIKIECESDTTQLIDAAGITVTRPNGNGDGAVELVLQPKLNQSGTAIITVTITDNNGEGLSDTKEFEYKVYPVNDAPVAVKDTYTVYEDSSSYSEGEVKIDPLDNDEDVDNDKTDLSIVSIEGLVNGYLESLGNNQFRYHPDENTNDEVNGGYTETLTYKISDGNAQSEVTGEFGKIYISVEPVNDPPKARSVYRVVEEFDQNQTAPFIVLNDKGDNEIRKNDYDIEDTVQGSKTYEVFTIIAINGTPISKGDTISTEYGDIKMANDENGTLTYTRTKKCNGIRDSFTYTIADFDNISDPVESTATVYIDTEYEQGIWIEYEELTIYEDGAAEPIVVNYSVPDDFVSYEIIYKKYPGDSALDPDDETSAPAKGIIESVAVDKVNTTITFNYKPSEDKNGSDFFTYKIKDTRTTGDTYSSDMGKATIDITPVNDKPEFYQWTITNDNPTSAEVAAASTTLNPVDSITIGEDSPFSPWYTVVFKDNKDLENDGDSPLKNKDLSFELTIGNSGGEPILTEDNIEIERIEDDNDKYSAARFRFKPTPNLNGTIQDMTISVSDGEETAIDTFDLIVTEVNDPPNAPPYHETISEDSILTKTIVNTGSDLEDKDLVDLAIVSQPTKGTVEIVDNKTIVYTPDHDVTGTDEFIYTITDSEGQTNTGDVNTGVFTIDITPINDPPNVSGYEYKHSGFEDNSIEIDFIASDIDSLNSELSFELIGSYDESLINNIELTKGIDDTTGKMNMNIKVVPVDNMFGEQILNIRVKDNHEPAGYIDLEFLVKFEPVNDIPDAVDDPDTENGYYEVGEDKYIDLPLLDNDTDADMGVGDDKYEFLHVSEIIGEFKGEVSINNDGTVRYTPPDNYYCEGEDIVAFNYTVSDKYKGEDTATVRIKVLSENDDPKAKNDEATTDEDTPVTINVLANDTDVENDTLSVVKVDGTSNAAYTGGLKADSIVVDEDGNLYYTPKPDAYGVDTFVYTVSDIHGGTATATVEVTINSIIDEPVLKDDIYKFTEFVIFEDTPKAFDVHYWNVEDVFRNVVFTVESDNINILKDTGITAEKTSIPDDAPTEGPDAVTNGPEDIWLKMTFDPVTNMNTGNPTADNHINVVVTKKIGTLTPIPTDVFPMYVLPVNDSPKITSVNADLNTNEDNSVSGKVAGSDQETATDDLRYFAGKDGNVDVKSGDDPYADISDNKVTITTDNGGTVVMDTDTGDYTYTPHANFSGQDTFYVYVDDNFRDTGDFVINGKSYVRKDGSATAAKLVTVEVAQVNDPPVANDDSASTDEDTEVTINVLLNDTDVENDPLSIITDDGTSDVVYTGGSKADSIVVSLGTIVYTPKANVHGEDTFTYQISDGNGGYDTAEVTVTINSTNDVPIAVDDSYSVPEDSVGFEMAVLTNDINNDRSDLSTPQNTELMILSFENSEGNFVTEGRVGNGAVKIVNNKLEYSPDLNFVGSDTFRYKIGDSDGVTDGDTDIAEISITVTQVNDPPEAQNDAATTNEDMPVTITVKDNDSDVEDARADLDVYIVVRPSEGPNNGIAVVSDGKIVYTPAPDFYGNDTLKYTVKDSVGDSSNEATVTITINPDDDDVPISVDDSIAILEDAVDVEIDVLNNDINPDRPGLSEPKNQGLTIINFNVGGNHYTDEGIVTNGYVKILNNKLYYTPRPNFDGSESFAYAIEDENGDISEAIVNITITPQNDPPEAEDDSAVTNEDTPVIVSVKANDSDVEDDNSLLELIELSNPENGTAVDKGDGTIEYTPKADFYGTDNFTYKLKDSGDLKSDKATVTITINPNDDDSPIAADDTITILEDAADTEIDVLNNDINPDRPGLSEPKNQELTIVSFEDGDGDITTEGAVENGYVKILNNKLYYNPDSDFDGTETFTYKIKDANGDTDEATVEITITSENDPPKVEDDPTTTKEDKSVVIPIKDNDSDAEDDNDDLVIHIISYPTNGTIEIIDDGTIKYTPKTNFTGVDMFTYKLQDSNGVFSELAEVDITVEFENDIPQAEDDDISVPEDTADYLIDVLDNDKNPDRSNLADDKNSELIIVSFKDTHGNLVTEGRTRHGSIKIENNQIKYTPDHDFEGADRFSYRIEDKDGDVADADVKLTVVPGEEIPVVTIPNLFDGIYEDQPLAFEVNLGPYVYDQDDGDNWDIPDVDNASHGTASFDKSTKILTYKPDANYNGMDSIHFYVEDDKNSVPVTVKFEITPVNDTPIGEDDFAIADEDTVVTIDVISNDHDIDNDPLLNTHDSCVPDILSILESGIIGVDNGAVTVDGDTIVFTPNPNWNGVEVFTYTVQDNAGLISTAQVEITLNPVDDGVLVDPNNSFGVTEDDGKSGYINVENLVIPDPDGGESIVGFEFAFSGDSRFTAVSDSEFTCQFGTYYIDRVNGEVSFKPVANYNGTVTFPVKFRMSDGRTKTFEVPISVAAENDPAVAADDFKKTAENTPVDVPILLNDHDIDTDAILNHNPFTFDVQVLSQPSNGIATVINAPPGASALPTSASRRKNNELQTRTISLVARSTNFESGIIALADDASNQTQIRYTPNSGFYGIDTFEYGFHDGNGDLIQATVTIEILNSVRSSNEEENPKTGYFIINKIEEFLGLK